MNFFNQGFLYNISQAPTHMVPNMSPNNVFPHNIQGWLPENNGPRCLSLLAPHLPPSPSPGSISAASGWEGCVGAPLVKPGFSILFSNLFYFIFFLFIPRIVIFLLIVCCLTTDASFSFIAANLS